jgi:hypothetical protein
MYTTKGSNNENGSSRALLPDVTYNSVRAVRRLDGLTHRLPTFNVEKSLICLVGTRRSIAGYT